MMDLAAVRKAALTFLLLAGVVALPLTLDATTSTPEPLFTPRTTACDAAVVDEPDVDQAPVCLLIPECFRNSDCDALCGPRQGRCVHNDCPARVCRCR